MPDRSIRRGVTVIPQDAPLPNAAPIYVDSDDDALKYIPAGTGTTERAFGIAYSTSGFRMVGGTGTLVTGALVVATGLSTVLGFVAMPSGNGASTGSGAGEVSELRAFSITTGAVTVKGAYHHDDAATGLTSVSGNRTFYWFAVGT